MPLPFGRLSPDGRRVMPLGGPLAAFDVARLGLFAEEAFPHDFDYGRVLCAADGSRLRVESAEPIQRSTEGYAHTVHPVVQMTSVAPDGRPIARFPAVRGRPFADRVFSDGRTVVVPRAGGIDVRRLPDFRLVRTVDGDPESNPSTSADERRTVYLDRARRLTLAQRRSDGTEARVVLPATTRYSGLLGGTWISPNGRWAVIAATDRRSGGTVHYDVWDLDARRIRSSSPNFVSIDKPLWLPDGTAFLTCSDRNGLVRHDLASGVTRRIAVLPAGNGDCALSPDGTRLAYRTDGDLWLFDARTGRELLRFGTLLGPGAKPEPSDRFRLSGVVDFTPDGRTLIDAGLGKKLRIYRSDPPR